MSAFIKKIQSNTSLTVLTAIVSGIVILLGCQFLADNTVLLIEKFTELNFYTENTVFKLYILIFSIVFILILNKGSLKNYGFTRAVSIKYPKMILITIGITIASFVVGGILFMGILSNVFPTENTKAFPEQESIIEMILTIWIWSSICEEVLVRGLMQGFMNHIKTRKILGLSLPVIISGVFFGCMHLGLLTAGMGHWFVSFIVFNTTVIGLLAAFYREKSGSLIPPILIHFLANFIGSVPLIIKMIIS